MSRSQASDPLSGFRFHVKLADSSAYGGSINTGPGIDGGEAGFTQATNGEISIDSVDYREGLDVWTKKFPGIPQTNPVTLTRGVMLLDSDFYDWALACIEGRECRADVNLFCLPRYAWQRDRADVNGGRVNTGGLPEGWEDRSLKFLYHEAICTRFKPGDMDATNTAIMTVELEFAFEYPEIIKPTDLPG